MFKHILVPVDGSETSMLAVSKAAGLAKTFGSAVTAVYVVDPYPFTGVGADFAYGQAQYINAATAEANTALEATRKAMAEAGVQVTTVVGEGHAASRNGPAMPLGTRITARAMSADSFMAETRPMLSSSLTNLVMVKASAMLTESILFCRLSRTESWRLCASALASSTLFSRDWIWVFALASIGDFSPLLRVRSFKTASV